jgi:hypothetical protein
MTNHRITSQPWQLKAAAEGTLKAIVLPLVPEIEPHIDGINMIWRNKKVTAWITKLPSEIAQCSESPYQLGDLIYLAEEWFNCCLSDDAWGDTEPVTKSSEPDYIHQYQPAQTMPPEAAQYWFEIKGVRVVQMSDIDRHLCDRAALTDIPSDFPCGVEEWASILMRWNAAHPDYLWDADRWVIVLDLNIIGEPSH